MKVTYTSEDELGYYEFITKFNKYTHYQLENLMNMEAFDSYKDKFECLRNLVFTDFKRQTLLFYVLLNEYGYNFKYDIIDAIKDLVRVDSLTELFDCINYYQNSLAIDKILYENGVFTILSNGISYKFASIKNYKIGEATEMNMCVFTPFQAVIPKQFYKDSNGMIIDFNSGIVMSEENFTKLYEPLLNYARTRRAF